MMPLRMILGLWLAAIYSIADSRTAYYVGPETCALCHQNIARTQEQSPMAKT